MYSLVLLTALAPGADVTPAPAPVVVAAPVATGCCGSVPVGCTGCYGSCTGNYGSCYGCSGCYGSSCHGGGIFGHRSGGGLFKHKHSCYGCSGYSCTGFSGCTGCYGSCSGCLGYAGFGGGASSWGPPVGMPPYTLHGYNQGGAWGYGPPVVWADPQAVYGRVTNLNPTPATDVVPSDVKPMTEPKKPVGASIKFKVPADAKLYVDGKLTALTGTERAFTTPPLAAGQKFFYDVKAELAVGGKLVTEEKRVVVEAGAELTESFAKLVAAGESAGTPVAGK